MKEVKTFLESGVPHHEIIHYFKALSTFEKANTFKGDGWKVTVLSMNWNRMGSLLLPSTRLEFRGDPTAVEKLVKEYRMRFLSAGG